MFLDILMHVVHVKDVSIYIYLDGQKGRGP